MLCVPNYSFRKDLITMAILPITTVMEELHSLKAELQESL